MVVKRYVVVRDVEKTVAASELLSLTPHRTKESNGYAFVSFKFPVLHIPVKSTIVDLFFCGVHIRYSFFLVDAISSRILALVGVFECPVWKYSFVFESHLLNRYRRRGVQRVVRAVQVTSWSFVVSY